MSESNGAGGERYEAMWRCHLIGFDDGGERNHKQRNIPLEAEKDKEIDFSVEPLEGTQPCQHLGFRPAQPISDFSAPELQDNKCILF